MADYIRILTKIQETPWMITPESLQVILNIVDRRVNGESLTDEQIEDLLTQAQLKNHGRGSANSNMSSPFDDDASDERAYKVVNGLGILPLNGPIFGKANLMTQLSGATSLETFQSDFRSMMKDEMIHSILLDIDSPGGSADMVQEVAQEIGISLEGYQHILGELRGLAIGSLHEEAGQSGAEEEICAYQPGVPEEDPFLLCMRSEMKHYLTQAIGALPEKERMVLSLYYFEELTMKEISLVLGVVESRVSQIHSSAVLHLRTKLKDCIQTRNAKKLKQSAI